ncbi:MAG: exodeoxyribonuclease V subunit gamma [Rhodocyclaceae bacterium]|nr:exodeoxyribonuclease V subunit gamma [Rhodocyclaceae bacterium]MBX3667265.1 exodeoxyribonuclease V subunit gamma [Rhodocyclaceae bacterium]
MFRITFSNRCEYLLERLCDELAAARGDPFEPAQIIVPGAALRRRIELALAERAGICANIEFSYLGAWLWHQIGRLVAVEQDSPFAPERLLWRIYALFGDAGFTTRHARLAAYLAAADASMRLELARKAAALIEQYTTYRPDWLDAWQQGKSAAVATAQHADAGWQAELWRRICADLGVPPQHPAEAFFRRLETDPQAVNKLAPCVHVFGLPTLPPFHLHLLGRLGQHVEVRAFMLNPCQEFWFDLVDPKRLSYLRAHDRADYHESGHALLAAWGKQTQSCLGMVLADEAAQAVEEHSLFLPLAASHRLAHLHNAILDLAEPAPGSQPAAADDRSVEVHVCHSAARELEVLHDQLLARFAADASLRPQDILVATPDIEAAAPLIDAVFGQAPAERRIPFTITGRAASGENPVARALCELLGLARGRHTASAVFGLLQQMPVAEHYGFGAADFELLREWMSDAGIRWALDAAEKREFGLPPSARHSFDDGLQRLFLAYALGDTPALCAGRHAAGNPEGRAALLLGRFASYIEWLHGLAGAWAAALPAAAWRSQLYAALESLVPQDGIWLDAVAEVRAGLSELFDAITSATPDLPLPLDVVREAVADLFARAPRGGVPSGAVTFAAMGALRNLPYRVVCLTGMNDGVFPATARPVEFDLMAAEPRPGDRQRREDDRNLFLDLVLAARDALIITCTGRSQRDASPLPPSVLVSELLDQLATAAADPADTKAWQAARRAMLVEHPLQPFAAEYFSAGHDPRLVSYKREYFDARLALFKAESAGPAKAGEHEVAAAADDEEFQQSGGASPAALFFRSPLPALPPAQRMADIEGLQRFFRNPCRWLLQRRLDIALADAPEQLADDESFLADFPARQALAERLLPAALAGRPLDQLLSLARAGVEYPEGNLGALQLEQELAVLGKFAAGIAEAVAAPPLPPLTLNQTYDLAGETWRLEGTLVGLRAAGQVLWRYDDTRATDYLTAWIRHLFACAAAPQAPPRTEWHSRDGRFGFRPVEDAHAQLGALLDLYRRGQTEPLYFFPKSAWAFMINGENSIKAQQRWAGRPGSDHGECQDPAYRLALRGVADPLAEPAFEGCAKAVYGPLLYHLEDERLA